MRLAGPQVIIANPWAVRVSLRMTSEPTEFSGPSDAELVHRARAGDRNSFGVLVDRYQKRATSVAYRLLGNRDDALEVSQDAFVKTWERLNDLHEPGKFGAWLLRTVSNLSLNFRRDRKPTVPLPMEPSDRSDEPRSPNRSAEAQPLAQASADELSEAAAEAMRKLPEKQRMALVLFAMEGLPQQQVADVLDTSVEAVKWHVFQARKKLREMLARFS